MNNQNNPPCPCCAERARLEKIACFSKRQSAVVMKRLLEIRHSTMTYDERMAACDKVISENSRAYNTFFDNLYYEMRQLIAEARRAS